MASSSLSRAGARVQHVLPLLVLALFVASHAAAAGVLTGDAFAADMTLAHKAKGRKDRGGDPQGPLPTGVAWDGSHFWTSSGGDVDTTNLLRWCTKGTCVKDFDVPHIDIRSIWTQGEGSNAQLYADAFSDEHVYVHKDDGTFEATGVTLTGPQKDVDSPVLYRPASRPEDPKDGVLVAQDGTGVLLEYHASSGAFLREVPFRGFGSEPGETDWPNYVRFAVAQVDASRYYYLTYAGGQVHAWDADGRRAGSAKLEGAADDEVACHSMSYARERIWIRDTTSGAWKGYKLSFVEPEAKPEPYAAAAAAADPVPADALSATPAGEVCPIATE